MARVEAAQAGAAPGWRVRAGDLTWRVAPFVSVGLLILVWEVVARSGTVTAYMLPGPATVFERIGADAIAGDLWINMALTLYRAFAGFAIAAVVGIALGFAMARNRIANWFFLPIVILWLGLFDVTKVTMVALDAVFPVITATLAGIAGVERELIWSARNMGASEREVLHQVV